MPVLPHPRQDIEVPAVTEPHQGTSYNPPVDAHQELLLEAHEKERKRLREEQKIAEIKEKFSQLHQPTGTEDGIGTVPGMKLDEVAPEEEEEEEQGGGQSIVPSRKTPARQTKKQRRRAAEQLALVWRLYISALSMSNPAFQRRSLEEKAARKRLAASVGEARTLRKASLKLMKMREEEKAQRRLAMKYQRRRRGLAGQRLGKHVVPEGGVEVQLGEDLSESLRAMKVCSV